MSAAPSGKRAGVGRSPAGKLAAVAMAVALVVALGGCATSRETASLMRLNNNRTLASQADTRVRQVSAQVKPTQVALVRSSHRNAIVVTVHNSSKRVQSDLPISVGYTQAGGQRVFLNRGTSLTYFNAHLPGIRPGRSLIWVFTTAHQIPAGVRAFARIGPRPQPVAPAGSSPVSVSVRTKAVSAKGLNLVVTNNSGLPQYQLQIYSYARHDGRYVAAANVTLQGVNPGVSERVHLPLVGKLAGARPITTAVPTILQ
jgi:hypothetical protein